MAAGMVLERQYDVVAATGLHEPMVRDFAYDAVRGCLWATVQQYQFDRWRLLKLTLASGDMDLLDLPSERHMGGPTVGKDGEVLIGALEVGNSRVLFLDGAANTLRTTATSDGWPMHIWETERRDLILSGGSRHGGSRVCCYSSGGSKHWQAEFSPGINSVIPIYHGGRTFAVTQSSRISVIEIDSQGAFIAVRDIGPADIRPSLSVAPGSSSKHLGWSRSLLDAAAGPDTDSLLILYSFPIHFRQLYGRLGAKLLLLYYRLGRMPLAFEPPTRVQKIVAAGPNRVAGLRQIIPHNECVISTYGINDWEEGVPLESVAATLGDDTA